MQTRWLAGVVVVGVGCAAGAQVTFVERTDVGVGAFEVPPASMAIGISAVDYDRDGDIDLLVPTALGFPPQLLQNDGSGNFTDVAAAAGLSGVTSNDRVALFLDYDGDRDLDLILGCDQRGFDVIIDTYPWQNTLRLFRQDAGVFTEVTAGAGLGGVLAASGGEPSALMHLGGISTGDLDGDGDLDLYAGIWGGPQFLFRYTGEEFVDATPALDDSELPLQGNDWQQVMWDIDEDGLLDIFCAIDFLSNRVWMNQGGLVFHERATELGLDGAWNEMGVAVSDYDNDGDLDIYITNINDPQGNVPAWTNTHNVLYRDDGAGATPRFTEVSVEAGVAFGDWGWGCDFADFDLDGRLDLIATNGYAKASPFFFTDKTRLWRNLGGSPVTFAEIGAAAGADDDAIASGLVTADFDRDGDLDYVQVTHDGVVRYMENTTPANGNGWLVVRPRRYDGLDHYSIGAVVTVEAGGETMTRLVSTGASILSQKPYEAHFGLGSATKIDRIEVRWVDGKKRVILNDTRMNHVLTLTPADAGTDTYDAAAEDVPFGGFVGRRIVDDGDWPEQD